MIQLLFGENDYALRQAEGRVRDAFIETYGDQSVSQVQADTLTPADLPQLLQGTSLFATENLTILYDTSANKPVWDALAEFLAKAEAVDLLLVETKPDKRTKTFKWLQKNAETKECKLLDERTTISWLQTEARRQGIELNHELAQHLVRRSGTEQWRLHNDIAKLALVDGALSREVIDRLIEAHPSASVFDVLGAVATGKSREALETIRILRTYEDPYKFFGLLVAQLYQLALCVTSNHRPTQQIATDSGIHPFALQQTMKIARYVDRTRLQAMVEIFEHCDTQMKTTGADQWLLIETAIGSIPAKT